MSVHMFPGQGAQRKGMGRALFEEYPETVARANEILGYSIVKLCQENPNRLLGETQYTQPAMYVVNALSLMKRQASEDVRPPSYFIGHSLGEYNALHAAGVMDFETGLRLVKRRGEVMGRVEGGGMAAVVGLSRWEVARVLEHHDLTDELQVANDNAPDQVVISGSRPAVLAAAPFFEARPEKPRYTVLSTSGAFHSRYMEDAQLQFARYLQAGSFTFDEPRVPVIANVDGKPYDRSRVEANLIEQITGAVRWVDSIRYLLDLGEEEFVEVGAGRVLSGLLDSIRATPEAAAWDGRERS
jgi:malonyl CoA-acyl carrier protein transacylase